MAQRIVSGSSSVKVEYHDPHNVFSLIAADLAAHVPLRNLNWNSPHRPLRLIDTLYIAFEPVDAQKRLQVDISGDYESASPEGRSRSHSLRKQESDGNRLPKERRHQIPGLQQAPYLKLLLIKCTDTESYKTSSRKEIREWIKIHTPPSQKSSKSSKQEDHAAFEWMILHVVVSSNDGKISWPDRNSGKILGYLKDDFNGSSKTSIDRITQIPASSNSSENGTRDSNSDSNLRQQTDEAWDDVLSKFKQLILTSFDQRVRQYEEDIKEKGNQKSLPGWNFNTYFVLKEGLVRGFESVGLVEDALNGYDELQIELDAAIRNKSGSDDQIQNATMFRESSPEIDRLCNELGKGPIFPAMPLFDDKLLESDAGRYRDLILSSDISVFDFKTYVFTRQIGLLRRLGTVTRPGTKQTTTFEPRFICEICQRAIAFIASTCATLRGDATSSMARATLSKNVDRTISKIFISQLVAGWTYAVSTTILRITDVGENIKLESVLARPLIERPLSVDSTEKPLPQWQNGSASPIHLTAVLASRQASLIRTARHALEDLATTLGWPCGWEAVSQEMNLPQADDDDSIVSRSFELDDSEVQMRYAHLSEALSSESKFRAYCEVLTSKALHYHSEAGDTRSARAMRMDLTVFKFLKRQYEDVINLIAQVDQGYVENAWYVPHVYILFMLSHCYKRVDDKWNYVKSCLRLLSCLGNTIDIPTGKLAPSFPEPKSLLSDLIKTSRDLDKNLEVSLDDFAEKVSISRFIQHRDDSHEISLNLLLRDTMLSDIVIEKVDVQLIGTDPYNYQECNLSSTNQKFPSEKLAQVQVRTSTVTPGLYSLGQVRLEIGHITFVHLEEKTKDEKFHNVTHKGLSSKSSRELLVWSPATVLDIEVDIFETVDLERPKSLVITICPGKSQPSSVTVRLKSGTSGLRIHTGEAILRSGDCKLEPSSQPGLINIKFFKLDVDARLTVPFQLDNEVKDIAVRSETVYKTDETVSRVEKLHKMSVLLPLGVNVQDLFKSRALFSRFAISSSNRIPLRIVEFDLQDFPGYQITCPSKSELEYPVLSKQPASLIYKIRPTQFRDSSELKSQSLRLKIVYRCLDEDIINSFALKLQQDLQRDGMERYSKLLIGYLKSTLVSQLSNQVLETAALLREVSPPTFEALMWKTLLRFLSPPESQRLENWLHSWHQSDQKIVLSTEKTLLCNRTINIPVDIPPMHIIQSASLRFADVKVRSTWHVGDAIPAEIQLEYTQVWGHVESKNFSQVETTYEIDAVPDTWVIGGQRRGTFRAKENETYRFPVLLIPQRIGYLPYPSIDVRIKDINGKRDLQCDLENRSQGKSMLIMHGINDPTSGVTIRPDRKMTLLEKI